MIIDIICKVVDNYGDIGFVYRLAKALSAADSRLGIRLHVDDLGAFRSLRPEVDPDKDVQELMGWTLLSWDSAWEGLAEAPPSFVLECFGCGRPDRLESLLFDASRGDSRWVLNIEHLSAEPWVEDFHRLPSLTRSSLVKKAFFMPGFTSKTGGLVIDPDFRAARKAWLGGQSPTLEGQSPRLALAARAGLALDPELANRFWVTVFSYEHAYGPIVRDLAVFNGDCPLLVLLAPGRSHASFREAYDAAGRPFPLADLPFLPQETWDEVLLASDFLIVRGEESLARAVLAGRPFLWHAYLQRDRHHLVKVQALLDLIEPFFAPTSFEELRRVTLAFNDRLADSSEAGGAEELLPLLRYLPALEPGFRAFSDSVFALGDLGLHLLTYIREIV